MSKISATVVADSLSPQNHRITSIEAVLPRPVLAELNTHRMFSRNSASSRAIPFKKMIQMVQENPFIPIAWQKDHKGMQGTEYLTENDESGRLVNAIKCSIDDWLESRNEAIRCAINLNSTGVTKQLCNRLLEPFMYHKVLITATEWENFFALRCPQYEYEYLHKGKTTVKYFKSKKDWIDEWDKQHEGIDKWSYCEPDMFWFRINKGQAEIHMMALAEAMWDAMNESTPKQLKAGEWHIPYGDKIDLTSSSLPYIEDATEAQSTQLKVKISTAMAARVSYTTVGDEKEVSYERLIGIHDRMKDQVPFHASPFEHCARAMSDREYEAMDVKCLSSEIVDELPNYSLGWCRNYRGFIQYRHLIETNNNM